MIFKGAGKAFDNAWIVRDMSFEVTKRTALLGRNGAGKTTLLRMAAGVLQPSEGRVECGRVAFVPQDAPIYPELTARQHAEFWASLHGGEPADLRAAGLPNPDALASTLSRGQRQRLHLAMALATPHALVLDEPFAALDEAGQFWLEQQLANRFPVLLSLHDEALAKRLCDGVIQL